jgi:hypothetical protein
MDANPELLSLDIAIKVNDCRETAKNVLLGNYEKSIKPYRHAIKSFSEKDHCSVMDATLQIATQLNKTGHTTLLVFAALADVVDGL